MRLRGLVLIVLVLASINCGAGAMSPVAFDASHEPCRYCRMTGSNGRFAAQIVTRSDEPLFFDDIGCLRDYLTATGLSTDAAVFVTDHRTLNWVAADRALYSQQDSVDTPMGSHLMAHESTESRELDPAARGSALRTAADLFEKALPRSVK